MDSLALPQSDLSNFQSDGSPASGPSPSTQGNNLNGRKRKVSGTPQDHSDMDQKVQRHSHQPVNEDGDDDNAKLNTDQTGSQTSKPKRVRTGCLTCRERHLKCDEGAPICQNCRKSNRECKRGMRLNFIDLTVKRPPVLPTSSDWTVSFQDESREIASEYVGGAKRYALPHRRQSSSAALFQQVPQQQQSSLDATATADFPDFTPPPAPQLSTQALPPMSGIHEVYSDNDTQQYQTAHSHSGSTYSASNTIGDTGGSSYGGVDTPQSPQEKPKDYLDSQEEVLFMQVFVDEVGVWMDSMDPNKHFSRLLPFHSLSEPMLLNAFLACGARHLALVNPNHSEDRALHYYDTATRYLLNSLQNPNRDTVICATTAVILNVYEIMCERAMQRMNHIAGARALIKECGWNARSTGIGAACFWLNVGMELLSCLHFNWRVAWAPDDWGVNMDFSREEEKGKEEIWTHRMVYIVAKIANFRATIPTKPEASPRADHRRFETRCAEWNQLKNWADSWNDNIPRTMHPMAYLYPHQSSSPSAFPEVWLVKRTTVVARLFYHTANVLLSQINPALTIDSEEMHSLQRQHSQLICGIVAHVKDRGVASVAIRSLAIAAECLTDSREQQEVLSIFENIKQETGWNVTFVNKELKSKWGWNANAPNGAAAANTAGAATNLVNNYDTSSHNMAPPPPSATSDASYHSHSHSHSSLSQSSIMMTQPPQTSSFVQPQQQQNLTSTMPTIPLAHTSTTTSATPAPMATLASTPPRRKPPQGILNPMLASADFTMPQHPYQSHYVPPNTFNFS